MPLLPPLAAGVTPEVPPALIAPFGLLLALIAVMPLTPPRARRAWHRFYPPVAVGLGLTVVAVYLRWIPGGGAMVGHMLGEYTSFICLLGALFVVAGGIHLAVQDGATPLENVCFLAAGALAANLIGTTGASVVLIRPWIRMNRNRMSAYHVVFFIFVVSNCGGALTPIGDPPLYLGYLRGVPFFWLAGHVWAAWLFTIGALLAVFYGLDRRNLARRPPAARADFRGPGRLRLTGGVNLVLLAVVVAAVFLPETWCLRELLMLAAAAVSLRLTPRAVHAENRFAFGPIREVAVLFFGIFLTMMPALNYLDRHGREFGLDRPAQYYFASGGLSAVLDNAPTYLSFLELAEATLVDPASLPAGDRDAGVRPMLADAALRRFVIAISLGSVFFGALTYLGNGPNFMVKAIAEEAGAPVPTFFGYLLRYGLPILLPILAAAAWLFL